MRVLARGARIDAADAGMRVRTAHEGRLQHARKIQVVDEPAGACEQRTVLDPPDRFADIGRLVHVFPPCRSIVPKKNILPTENKSCTLLSAEGPVVCRAFESRS